MKKITLLQNIKDKMPKKIRKLLSIIKNNFMTLLVNKNFKLLYNKYHEFTMIPEIIFYENLSLIKNFSNINGSVVECGVWRGGMIASMSEILGNQRKYYLFDSFEGLPKATEMDGKAANIWQKDIDSPTYFENCKAEIQFAQNAMKLSKTKNFEIIKGWFNETLPNFKPIENIAILRLDSDWYESTKQCLENLYQHVVIGGLIIIDDYNTWEGCSKAVNEYLLKNELQDTIYESKNGVCYIIKK